MLYNKPGSSCLYATYIRGNTHKTHNIRHLVHRGRSVTSVMACSTRFQASSGLLNIRLSHSNPCPLESSLDAAGSSHFLRRGSWGFEIRKNNQGNYIKKPREILRPSKRHAEQSELGSRSPRASGWLYGSIQLPE